jgi:hypothetical protein
MKVKIVLVSALLLAATSVLTAKSTAPAITGDYLEVRSCDVFVGACFANSEMGLTGKEALLVWSVRDGAWNGTPLDGLSIIAAVRTDATLGDVRHQPRSGKAVLIMDTRATEAQRTALADFARSMAGDLLKDVVAVKTASLEIALGNCSKSGCASVKVAGLVEITTRCLGDKDHMCANAEKYYPPLTELEHALPAFTEMASYQGDGLGLTWQGVAQRNAYLGTFTHESAGSTRLAAR